MKKKNLLCTSVCAAALIAAACGFTACSDESGEESEVLTESTDYSALVSEKVDADGWRQAFKDDKYGDCTIKLIYSFEEEGTFKYIRKEQTDKSNVKIVFTSEYMGIEESEYWKSENGIKYYYDGSWYTYDENDYAASDDFEYSYKFVCPDFGEHYESFAYNEQTKAYEFDGSAAPLKTNSILESGEKEYSKASVKIINGKIACIYAADGNSQAQIYFYDFGKTSVSLPD